MLCMKKDFLIKDTRDQVRVDKFLAAALQGCSRALVQKLIQGGKVLVNKKETKPHYQLKQNDRVAVDVLPPENVDIMPDPFLLLEVLYEDKDIVVINKPAGLVVHPSNTRKLGTLANALLFRYPEIRGVGEDVLRPGIVHRLDKDTSGVMVIAKHNQAFVYLKNIFKKREVEKRYLALVKGHLASPEGVINLKISRSKSLPTKQVTHETQGRDAITYYKVVKRFRDYDLVEAFPKTGRMHQIRVHFHAIGHPVVGDSKYGRKNYFLGLSRHFLHSYFLKFKLPNGKIKEFKADLPDDLQKALKTLTEEDI